MPKYGGSRLPSRPVRTKRSALQFALGVRAEILAVSTLSERNTASEAPLNFASRSRIRNRNALIQ